MRPYKENKRKQILAGLLFLVLGFCGCASEKKEEIGAREPAVYFVQERTDLFDETDLNEPAGELRAGSYCVITGLSDTYARTEDGYLALRDHLLEAQWKEDKSFDGTSEFKAREAVAIRDELMRETGAFLDPSERVVFETIEKDRIGSVRGKLSGNQYVFIDNTFDYIGPMVENDTAEPDEQVMDDSLDDRSDMLFEKDGIVIVNKKHGVAPEYAPGEDPKAKKALLGLIRTMQAEGLDISDSYSGFRSYEYQSELYNGYCASYGTESADTFSAKPGFSEHQTGLAFDLKHVSGELVTQSAESQWLMDHAAEHGFIVRYQEGKEDITGYQAEPWHIRYIGPRAKEIMESGLTLEEFLGVEGGDYAPGQE
ncbi:M15 family metallopeptidase [Erysipelotrichaceae bacterium 66-17]